MTPPAICPQPYPEDCPLFERRLVNFASTETLRRAVLTERHRAPDLADLVRMETTPTAGPCRALPPAPEPVRLSIFDNLKGAKQ